jgi:hypothetical protein
MSIAEEKAPGFRKQRRIGRLGHADGSGTERPGYCPTRLISTQPISAVPDCFR